MANFNLVNSEVNFYETEEVFFAEYHIDELMFFNIFSSEDAELQWNSIFKKVIRFFSQKKSILKTFSKLFPALICLIFTPEIFYYDYQVDTLMINIVELLPKILIGGNFLSF